MRENFKFRMWSPDSVDLKSIDLVIDHQQVTKNISDFEPSPYTFNKLENGKKLATGKTSLTPPSWLLLDHSIAVIWSLFSTNPSVQDLSIEDLKWTYEFLKEIKNKKGENPPDVKVCLQEIQDRLITLYAKLTSLNEDFNEITATFDEIMEESNSKHTNASFTMNQPESELAMLSASEKSLVEEYSSTDLTKALSSKRILTTSKNTCFIYKDNPNFSDDKEPSDEEEVEKYVLSLLEEDKKEPALQTKYSMKSLIPMKKKTAPAILSKSVSQEISDDITKKEKASKKVRCVAEMRSLKFQESSKVTDTNGEEAAYSNLKAEIQRLTINPDVSRNEVMKFLKDWRTKQVKRLHNELKKLGNIEEFVKRVNGEEVKRNNQLSEK